MKGACVKRARDGLGLVIAESPSLYRLTTRLPPISRSAALSPLHCINDCIHNCYSTSAKIRR